MDTSIKHIAKLATDALEKVEAERSRTTPEEPGRKRPRRACTAPDYHKPKPSSDARDDTPAPPSRPLVGRLLVVHANGKTYGTGGDSALTDDGERVKAAKRSNREDFDFTARDYCAMRDGGVYSGDPRKNKLLPLPRPTYTEFINRAKRARCLDRLDFVYCPADAPRLPALDYNAYTRVVYAGVSFRRFAQIWRPERHQFFKPDFQARVETLLAAAVRGRSTGAALGRVPDVVLHDVLAFASSKGDARRDDYDDLATINGGARHLFLPAPGSSGNRERLFDACFGL